MMTTPITTKVTTAVLIVTTMTTSKPTTTTMMMSSTTTHSTSSMMPTSTVSVQVIQVSTANNTGALVFTPNSVTAAVGSLVQFQFHPMNHSVVQSTFANPCIPINNIMPSVKGIFSGFQATTGVTTPIFTILINDTQPIWYYCSQGMHCQNGMVGVINPPSNATVVQFAALAAKATVNVSPGMTMMNTTMGTNTTLKANATMTAPITVQTHSAAGSLLAASQESLFSILAAGIIVLVGMMAM
ncbi:hypothetical protein MMC27_006878 [Xylographa pallens]|nr:hypothetical protein [Xylographa pallens]